MDWNFRSRSHDCDDCEGAFEDKQPYHTILFSVPEEFERMDVCPKCWEERHQPEAADKEGYISHWQGIYETPPPPPPEPIQKENAESLLRKLVGENDPQYTETCFILAVMLERKRILKNKDQVKSEDGRRVLIYEQPKTGDVFTILDPELQLDELDGVQMQVAALLEHGLNPPAEGEDSAEETTDGEAAVGISSQGAETEATPSKTPGDLPETASAAAGEKQ